MTVTNTSPPALSGTFQQGQTITTSNGEWDYDLATLNYAYQWMRCDAAGANCVDIQGATSVSYRLTAADVGFRIRSEVTATETDTIPPPEPTPPPTGDRDPEPPAWGAPVTISAGGTYEVAAEATGTNSAVTITTNQPVILRGWVKNTSGSTQPLIDADVSGLQLTVEDMYAYGGYPWQNSGRFIWTGNHHTLIVQNCNIQYTTGIEVGTGTAGVGRVLITKNYFDRIQGYAPAGVISRVGNMVQFRTCITPTLEVSWNELWNVYGQSFQEDQVSIYHTSNVRVLNNFFFHQSEQNNTLNSSFGGITLDASDAGAPVNNCHVEGNHLVDGGSITCWPNVGGGSNNLIIGNRVISDRYLPNGVQKKNGFVGILIQPGGSNNHAHNNQVGYWTKDGGRDDYIFNGSGHAAATEESMNTSLPEPINSALEQNEIYVWEAKKAANGISVGVPATSSPPAALGVDRTTMLATGGSILREDTAAAADPKAGLWGTIEAVSDARHVHKTTGGSTHLRADGSAQGNTKYRELTVVNGDDFFGERVELGRNESRNGENVGAATAGTFALFEEGDHKLIFWSMRLVTFDPAPAGYQAILQLKQAQPYAANGPVNGQPALTVQIWSNKLRLANFSTYLYATTVPTLNVWIRYALDVTFSSNPAVGKVRLYADIDNDGDFLDAAEMSPEYTVRTLAYASTAGSGYAVNDPIPGHLRLGVYHNPASYGTTVVDVDNVQVVG